MSNKIENPYNPLKRLADFLRACKNIDKNTGTSRQALAKLLNVQHPESPLFYYQLSKLFDLFTEIDEALRRSTIDRRRLNESLQNIINIFTAATTQLNAGWAVTANSISVETINLLEFGSDQLDSQSIEPSLDRKELNQFKEEIRRARDQIQGKDYPEDLRKAVTELLNKIEFGINQYELFGIDAFYSVFKDVVFYYVDNNAVLEKLKIDDSFEPYKEILVKFNKMMSTLKNVEAARQAISFAAGYLLG